MRAITERTRLAVPAPRPTSWWARARWFVSGVLGGNAYDAYLAYHARTGCGAPPMTKGEYWRARMDHQDANPQGRCC